jgi:hypothetical protein
MSLSRGYLSDGKPRLYVVDGLRLYFFYSTANRDAFLLARSAAVAAASRNWPKLRDSLSGPDSGTPASSGLVVASADASSSAAAPETSAGEPSTGDAAPAVAPAAAGGNDLPN